MMHACSKVALQMLQEASSLLQAWCVRLQTSCADLTSCVHTKQHERALAGSGHLLDKQQNE